MVMKLHIETVCGIATSREDAMICPVPSTICINWTSPEYKLATSDEYGSLYHYQYSPVARWSQPNASGTPAEA